MSQLVVRTVLDVPAPRLPTGRLIALAVSGVADAETCRTLQDALAAPGHVQLIVNLAGVRRLSPAAADVLRRFAFACAAEGRVLRVAGCPSDIAPALAQAVTRSSGLEMYRSMTAALTAVGPL